MNWNLIAWSFATVRKNKQLLLFPMFSAAAALLGILLCLQWVPFQKIATHSLTLTQCLWLAPAYVAVSFAIVFFNCALAACAQALFSGEEPTLGYGLRYAMTRVAPILAWALLSTTVGFILNAIERRATWAGKIAIWLFGTAWGMATYLVVPVLMAEERGAFASVRRSAQLLRDTWGEQIVAELRFGWRALVLLVPGVILGVIGANGYPIVLVVAGAYFAVSLSVLNAAMGIFEVALYRYAALHETPAGWSAEFMPSLFQGLDSRRARTLDI